jgi:hypothetical protein
MNTAIATPGIQYDAVLRNANATDGLSDRQIKAMVPAVFADHPKPDVSNAYGFMPTTVMLDALRREGFVPTEVRQSRRRNPEARQYAKHLIRFRLAGDAKPTIVGECVPQVVVVNSHDRSSKVEVYGGMLRLVCTNGLLVSDSSVVAPAIVRHTKNPVQELLGNIEAIIKGHRNVSEHVKQMRGTLLTDRQMLDFANEAAMLRFGNGTARGALDPAALLVPRRAADAGADLWHVFNRVQENMTKGGIPSLTASGRINLTRPAVSIGSELHINSGLWELAMATIAKARGSAAKATRKATA